MSNPLYVWNSAEKSLEESREETVLNRLPGESDQEVSREAPRDDSREKKSSADDAPCDTASSDICFVYRYLKKDRVVYVGITNNLRARRSQHFADIDKDRDLKLEFVAVPSRADADIMETYLISVWSPEFNTAKTDWGKSELVGCDLSSLEWMPYGKYDLFRDHFFINGVDNARGQMTLPRMSSGFFVNKRSFCLKRDQFRRISKTSALQNLALLNEYKIKSLKNKCEVFGAENASLREENNRLVKRMNKLELNINRYNAEIEKMKKKILSESVD